MSKTFIISGLHTNTSNSGIIAVFHALMELIDISAGDGFSEIKKKVILLNESMMDVQGKYAISRMDYFIGSVPLLHYQKLYQRLLFLIVTSSTEG